MSTSGIQRVKNFFRWYYYNYSERIPAPENIESREFGFKDFEDKMIRHISFKSEGEYKAYLLKNTPKSAYYSVAFYVDPTAPMEAKGWMKADVAFDIDIKDASKKIKENSFWMCKTCHSYGSLPAPEFCPKCGSKDVAEVEWVCDECLEEVKGEAQKLVDIFTEDFGLEKKDFSVYFSGNNGYHFYIYNETFRKMDQQERVEIVEYITLSSFKEDIYKKNAPISGQLRERKKVPIDPNVTVDVKRVFRAPETLHDESGLAKVKVSSLESFDPMKEAAVLPEEPVKTLVHYMPKIKLKGQIFGPFKEAKLSLPAYLAVYLSLKGLAQIVEDGLV